MKKYMNKLCISIFTMGVLLVSSCESDYLDTNPTDAVGDGTAVATVENAYMTLNGIAKIMTIQHGNYSQGFAGENAIIRLYENYPSQNYNYNAYASGWASIHNQEFHMDTHRTYNNYAWYYYYQIISNANVLINKVDEAEGSEADKKFIKASALTFRAYSFQKLVQYYCYRWIDSSNGSAQGLVLRLDDSTGDLAPATLAETYAQIYKDCEDAIALFKEAGIDRESGSCWIANENVAHAVYARAALNKLDYAKAASEANLAKAGYPLMDSKAYKDGFCNPTSEWIFGSYGSADENNWYWSYGTQYSCNGYYANNTVNGGGSIGRELINRIPDGDVRKEIFLTESGLGIDASDATKVEQTFGTIGLKQSGNSWVIIDEDAYNKAYAYVKAHQVSGLPPAYVNGESAKVPGPNNYHIGDHLKFWVFDTPGVGYLPFIRTSEMYLIEAEAYCKLGQADKATKALEDLNKVRNPQYSASGLSGDALWNEIMDYREVELWGEGFAWSDYKRWNRPVVRHSFAQGGNAHTAVAKTIPADFGNKWTWAVPLAETDYNKGFTMGPNIEE